MSNGAITTNGAPTELSMPDTDLTVKSITLTTPTPTQERYPVVINQDIAIDNDTDGVFLEKLFKSDFEYVLNGNLNLPCLNISTGGFLANVNPALSRLVGVLGNISIGNPPGQADLINLEYIYGNFSGSAHANTSPSLTITGTKS